MAKRKKTTRRRRIGAAALNPGSPVVQLGSVAVGFLLADTLNAPIDKMLKGDKPAIPAMTNKIVGAAEVGLGALLVMGKGKKSLIKTAAGGILAGAGLKRLLREFGVISGYQAVPVIGSQSRGINGYQAVPVIGNPFNPSGINGYRVNGGYMVNGQGDGTSRVMGNAVGSAGSGSGLMTAGNMMAN